MNIPQSKIKGSDKQKQNKLPTQIDLGEFMLLLEPWEKSFLLLRVGAGVWCQQ